MQRAITAQIEQAQRDILHREIIALPDDDPRREAWTSVGRTSSCIVTAHPTWAFDAEPAEWREMFTTYLGVQSIACRDASVMYRRIPVAGDAVETCDPYGLTLSRATLPIATYDAVHDEFQHVIADMCRQAHLPVTEDPRHLFHSLFVDPAPLLQAQPPAIIPDLTVDVALPPRLTRPPRGGDQDSGRVGAALPARRLLFDIKTTFGGGGIYSCMWARVRQSGAVEERAFRVDGEYTRHARTLDLTYGQGGTPFAQRLATFGGVRGLAVGQYAEVSADVESLIRECARAIARSTWRQSGARDEGAIRSIMTALLRRRVGLTAARAMARHRLRRIPLVGVPRATLDQWRAEGGARRHVGRQSRLLVGLEDVLAFQAAYRGPAGGLAAGA